LTRTVTLKYLLRQEFSMTSRPATHPDRETDAMPHGGAFVTVVRKLKAMFWAAGTPTRCYAEERIAD
jgi:hypothetical protein